jgi:hypothetical protein
VLDPWSARAGRARKTRRRLLTVLGVVITFLVVAGASAFAGVLVGLPRSPVTATTPTISPALPVPPVTVPTQPIPGVVADTGPSHCTHKEVPWMLACHGQDRMAQHSRVAPAPGPSMSPAP